MFVNEGAMATILCIDQPDWLITRQMVLEKNGHEVRTARDQAEALQLLQQHAVDCVLARHHPPLMDGIGAAAGIRQLHPRLPIVLLATGKPDNTNSVVDECLSNLDGPDALMRAVARVLQKKNNHKRLQENIRESMRLREEYKQLEGETIEVLRRILGRK
jgi:CheY-like chemotaxis protein